MALTFRIAMLPRGQGRPRATTRGGKFASVYSAPEDVKAQRTLASLAAPWCPIEPLGCELAVTIVAIFPRTAMMCRVSKRTGQPLGPTGREWHFSKPDADNVGKLVLDALKSFWRDDCQVCDLRVVKVIAALNEQPGYEITISNVGIVHGSQLDKAVATAEGIF